VTTTTQTDAYRDELTHLARALATAQDAEVCAALAVGCTAQDVAMFTQGNRLKRFDKLQRKLDLLRECLPEFDDLAREYTAALPLEAYDLHWGDARVFLRWLEQNRSLSPEQLDHLACQRARLEVEMEATRDRRGHVRFQELWSVKDQLAPEFGYESLRVHLNPIRVWTRLQTPVLLEGETPPTDVLFFAVRDKVNTAVLDPVGQELLRELDTIGPCTLNEWACLSSLADRDDLVELGRDLAEMGLVAFS
jgi:hypothetical protein